MRVNDLNAGDKSMRKRGERMLAKRWVALLGILVATGLATAACSFMELDRAAEALTVEVTRVVEVEKIVERVVEVPVSVEKLVEVEVTRIVEVIVELESVSTPEPAETLSAGVIFADDFRDPSSGWDISDRPQGSSRYRDGSLVIVNYTHSDMRVESSLADLQVDDVVVEVDMVWLGGTDDNWQNVELRDDGRGNAYTLGISADGYFVIETAVDGHPQPLVGPTRSPHIRAERNAVNTVRATAIGNTLTLTVNGHSLAEVTDNRLASGRVGLSVSSLAGDYSEVAFTRIVISHPE